ncbi:hypothetical protein, partial [Acetobacter fabarum]|uniref:hypothetical protein n=1 Tax=Acetobacter fabarum TaxID=483199 RepID=UPI00223012B1
ADEKRGAKPLLSRYNIRVGFGSRAIDEEGLGTQTCQVVDRLVKVKIASIEPDKNHYLSLINVTPKTFKPALY